MVVYSTYSQRQYTRQICDLKFKESRRINLITLDNVEEWRDLLHCPKYIIISDCLMNDDGSNEQSRTVWNCGFLV